MKKIVAVSGYFDPIHVGHIEYLEKAASMGERLMVIVNNDYQARLKKGKSFMNEDDRLKIVQSLSCVDEAYLSIDLDLTVCQSLKAYNPDVFANGGDRLNGEIPESAICKELNISIIDGLGEKIRSSSEYTGLKGI
tara:strand:- start:675 stop:1082 length:408 start_codon:yes stop_codon:yes gene_type:complete